MIESNRCRRSTFRVGPPIRWNVVAHVDARILSNAVTSAIPPPRHAEFLAYLSCTPYFRDGSAASSKRACFFLFRFMWTLSRNIEIKGRRKSVFGREKNKNRGDILDVIPSLGIMRLRTTIASTKRFLKPMETTNRFPRIEGEREREISSSRSSSIAGNVIYRQRGAR